MIERRSHEVMGVNLVAAKCIVLSLCFIVALFGILLPSYAGHGPGKNVILLYGNAVASGVLLAAGLVHMLPGSERIFAEAFDFPVAHALAGVMFCLLIIIEDVAMTAASSHHRTLYACGESHSAAEPLLRSEVHEGRGHSHSHDDCRGHGEPEQYSVGHGHGALENNGFDHGHSHSSASCSGHGPPEQTAFGHGAPQQYSTGHGLGSPSPQPSFGHGPAHQAVHGHGPLDPKLGVDGHDSSCSYLLGKRPRPMRWDPIGQVTSLLRQLAGFRPLSGDSSFNYPCECLPPISSGCKTCDRSDSHDTLGASVADGRGHQHEDGTLRMHAHGAGALGSPAMSLVKALCLFSALCFHSVIEGMGLGSATDASSIVSLAAAILAHKGLAAFALGAALSHDPELTASRFSMLALVFSLATPFGGLLGWLLSKKFGGLAVGVCTACSAGTFLQVATLELIPATLATQAEGRRKRCATIGVGYMLFAALARWC